MAQARERTTFRFRLSWLAAVTAAILLSSASAVRSEIVIERGDTLNVSVAEAPKLSGERKVDADGRITLPQIGGIAVAGSGLDAARLSLEQELVKRGILRAPTVIVEIARYRPVYVGGRVARPGAIGFEPGLTVRHALILAGGIGRPQEEQQATVNVPDLRARWQTASYQLLQVNSRIARLDAELTRNEADRGEVQAGSVARSEASALLSLDAGILADRLQTWSASQEHLDKELALFDLEIDVLGQQAALQEDEQRIASEQVASARSLVEKGLMPLPRLQELQHMQSQAAQDLLENRAFSARARQNRSGVEYQIASADIKWRMEIRQQLREAMVERARIKAELEALSTQIVEAGVSLSEADALQMQPSVVIYRTVDGREQALAATMNTDIRPGDILDISFAKEAS